MSDLAELKSAFDNASAGTGLMDVHERAVAYIEALEAELAVERGERDDDAALFKLIAAALPHEVEHRGQIPDEVRRLVRRIPDPDDLRAVLDAADTGIGELYGIGDVGAFTGAVARVRATLEDD
jgi:hypothetical protein